MSEDLIQGIPALGAQERVEAPSEGVLCVRAPAKINLDLLVGPRRQDGYHSLDSYVCKLTLYDRIGLRRRGDGQIRFSHSGIECGPAESNLALRAARLLAEARDVPGVDLTLHKTIAPGAGLGGGSSDAAAVLWGLDRLWGLGLAADQLADLAARLGSDVPLFLGPACSRMTGRGETLAPVDAAAFYAVLILPPVTCSTQAVYRQFDLLAREPATQLPPQLLPQPPSAWRAELVNQLGQAARAIYPDLARLWDQLREVLPLPVHLTGSGSGLFVLCDHRDEAADVARLIPPPVRSWCVGAERNPW